MDSRKVDKRKHEGPDTNERDLEDPMETPQLVQTVLTSENEEDVSFIIREKRRRNIQKYNGQEIVYTVKLDEGSFSDSTLGANSVVINMFQSIIDKTLSDLNENDLTRICISSKSLENAISTSLMKVSEMTPEKIVSNIEKVL